MNKVLIIEDDPNWYMIFQTLVGESTSHIFDYVHVVDLASALEALKNDQFYLILLDLMLPDSHGINTIESVVAQARATPIVVISTLDDEQLVKSAFNLGVEDYLIKDQYELGIFIKVCRSTISKFLDKFSSIQNDLKSYISILEGLDKKLAILQASITKTQVK